MLNKMRTAIRRYEMVSPGDTVICAVSGGADSMALLWGMFLLKEKLGFRLEAAHFNHGLRGAESDSDAEFVRKFCDFHDIPLHLGSGNVVSGAKGLEAAARDARYAFLRGLCGTIATAHTADDNAETVLLHLLRGSGLRGLGGITPKSDRLIRPMLDVTRAEVEEFLNENYIRHMEDSSNGTDAYLRNRLRHHVMPLLRAENPSIATGLSAAAQRIRADAQLLDDLASELDPSDVAALRDAPGPLRRRALERLLRENGFPEPSASHLEQAESVVFSANPSARVTLSGVTLRRSYGRLCVEREQVVLTTRVLPREGLTELPEIGLAVRTTIVDGPGESIVSPLGQMVVRSRQPGDSLTTKGGTKTLKKRFIDRKLPQWERPAVPVIADERGVLAVYGFGPDENRRSGPEYVRIEFVPISAEAEK
ncbi:MAG: tRNA lysidine(34) synthetase TilS [Oscillospiraceae bacterium]|nr:tRNA lysidine(34) synthetase TilS [Oscillospiraceae bacterium]